MQKIKIIANYCKNIENPKNLNLPHQITYLRESYISPVGDIIKIEGTTLEEL